MAIKPCSSCGVPVNEAAMFCSNCGKKLPPPDAAKNLSTKVIFFAICVVVLVLLRVFGQNDDIAPPASTAAPVKSEPDPRTAAVWACREAVRRVLKDPDSGHFELPEESYVNFKANDLITVQIHGKARNSFNAVLRHTWQCELRKVPDGHMPLDVKELS